MESFLRRKLAQAGGNVLGGSSLQQPVSSYQSIKLPGLCSSFYSIADEPFPQVSGFLDVTASPPILSNEAGTVLNSPACTPSENQTKNKDEGILAPRKEATNDSGLNCSLGAHCQLANGSTSTRSPQNEKDITSATAGKANGDCNDATVSTASLEKSEFMSVELKNSTFDVTQDSKERSDAGINATVDLHNIREKNNTFESQEPKEESNPSLNSTVDIDVPNIKTESGNTTVDLVQSHDPKEGPDTGVNATVDIPNLDCAHSKTNSSVDNNEPLNTTTEQPNEKLEETKDIRSQEKLDGSFNSTEADKKKNTEETDLKVNVTVDIVEQIASAPLQPSGEVEQSSSATIKPAETTKHNTTIDLTHPEVPVLKDTTVEMKPSSTELADQVNDASNSVGITKPASNSRETEVGISATAFVCSVDAPDDASELKAEEPHEKKTSRPGLADAESIPSSDMGNISRNSIFCLDDTLDMKTSFLVTSTPIVFGKESRFEILRDVKPTPMRKRLCVINSIEAQSNDELVCASNHDGTDAVQVTESSSQNQKVTHSTSEPANENKPPTKPPIKRRLPQLSSKLSYPKSSLPPRPQLSINSLVAIKPKTIQGPPAPHQPDTSPTTLLGSRKTVQMNKGKTIAPVKSAASASTVKTSMVSSVTGYNFTAVAKPSGSAIPQMKPSGLQPPSRKRLALKTPQTTRSSVETVQTQPSNKPSGLPGMRTRNSLLPSVGQKHLNNDGLPSAKRKRIGAIILESDAVHPAEGSHEPGCVNCLQHQEKLERVIQELMGLRSECKNWGPLHEKLEKCVEELKRI
uniref:Flocculation protein FLO11-like n=1 Tax=Sinocyclocheilus anshuiensis TaxID=1608454 RepID=A0A671NIS1_9TELE